MGMIATLARTRARTVGVLLLTLGLAAGLMASTAGGASARGSAPAAVDLVWAPAVPQPGTGGTQLRSVRCVSRTDCWAVGSYLSHAVSHNEALHWNGRIWSLVGMPSPGTLSNFLESVSCTSAADCWAVGTIERGSSGNPTALNEALHWNGRSWSTVSTPDPEGTAPGDANELHAVTCPSPTSCWAVGEVLQGFAVPTNQALHWDGHAWSQVSTPTPGEFSLLFGARCRSVADCRAVGFKGAPGQIGDEALHWDGHTWSLVPTPSPRASTVAGGLSGVRCTSPANCWAVGSRGDGTRLLNEALHWDGRTWSRVSIPNPTHTSQSVRNALQAVSCTSFVNCWAVGSHQFSSDANSAIKDQALHWNGHGWSRVPTPNPAGTVKFATNQLYAVACITPANCWAVGSDSRSAELPHHNSRNQILHWNGTSWSAA
jgi:hypothetical protein